MSRRSAERERGAVITEIALIAPLLALLISGIVDLGLAFRDSNVVANSSRAGARTAASQGARGPADYYTLQALKSGLVALRGANIERVVIYNATANSDPDPNCLTMSAPGGQTGTRACNVYNSASLDLGSSSFSSTGSTCASPAVDRYYCPLTRSVAQGSGTDYLGVYVKLSRPTLTKIVGASMTLHDRFVVRLEPA